MCIYSTGIFTIKTHRRPRQNGRHFADDIFKRIFFNENVRISIRFSLKFYPKSPINNIPALVQIMAWRRAGDKPLSDPMMVRSPTHILALNELNNCFPIMFLYKTAPLQWIFSQQSGYWWPSVATVLNTRSWVSRCLWVNSLRPRQNDRHFADDTFKRILLNENVRISIKISLKLVPMGERD